MVTGEIPLNSNFMCREQKDVVQTEKVNAVLSNLPLLIPTTAHLDVTLQTYHYQFVESFPTFEYIKPKNKRLSSIKKVPAFPRLKKNFAVVVQNAKHKVTQAFYCLPCISGDSSCDDRLPAPLPSGTAKCLDLNGVIASSFSDKLCGGQLPPDEGNGVEFLSPKTPSAPNLKNVNDESIDNQLPLSVSTGSHTDHVCTGKNTSSTRRLGQNSSNWAEETLHEGRRCFQEAQALTKECRAEVRGLRDAVAITQSQLQGALCQLWKIEAGLHDHIWESVDRDTWTTYLLPNQTSLGLPPYSRCSSVYSSTSSGLFSEAGFLWEWSLV